MWDRVVLDEYEIRRGLDAGSLVTDIRLRDAFRAMRESRDTPPMTPEEVDVASGHFNSAVFSEAEVVRLQRWLDGVHRRVVLLESEPSDQEL
jgi:hypothetical protein